MRAGASWQDTMLSLSKMCMRHRAAIIRRLECANRFTEIRGIFTPGQFKGFLHSKHDEAVEWVEDQVLT